jgi:predicted nuclease of predicted toxin-antitoxin system
MLILLDENLLSKKLKQPFLNKGYYVYNIDDMGWRGFKDREVLNLANKYPFDVFITADKNLRYQQNLFGITLRVVILGSRSTRPDYLLPLMEKISEAISTFSNCILIWLVTAIKSKSPKL